MADRRIRVELALSAECHGQRAGADAGGYDVGVEPGMFGGGPIPAIRKALAQAGWEVEEVDRFEVNEAFAAIALAVRKELKIDAARFNVDGGDIAHGHPIGATGAILITKAVHALARTAERRAVVSLCIGGGQGIALALERP